MFAEFLDIQGSDSKMVYTESMNDQTRPIFMGSLKNSFGKSKDTIIKRKDEYSNLRSPSHQFFPFMINNFSTGSLSGISQLKAYRNLTGEYVPIRKLKNH